MTRVTYLAGESYFKLWLLMLRDESEATWSLAIYGYKFCIWMFMPRKITVMSNNINNYTLMLKMMKINGDRFSCAAHSTTLLLPWSFHSEFILSDPNSVASVKFSCQLRFSVNNILYFVFSGIQFHLGTLSRSALNEIYLRQWDPLIFRTSTNRNFPTH